MNYQGQSFLFHVAILALLMAFLVHEAQEQNSLEEFLSKKRDVISCGPSPTETTISNQPLVSTLSGHSQSNVPFNQPNGYGGDQGDQNSCPHQSMQSSLWISTNRKYRSHYCG